MSPSNASVAAVPFHGGADPASTAEGRRLAADAARTANWKRWGPYLAERQWGTVREDYSATGECWTYFPHDQARSRAYRWGEDGLLGITDRECRLCFALAMWNGKDPILKERLFGLSGPEGNHGEDVKEEYFYLDSTPTHSYMKALYKYPQAGFPYERLVAENQRRGKGDPEFELSDTGIFGDNRCFDVHAEYAKAAPDDILIRITVTNRAPEAARLDLLPTLWFRNSWSWGCTHEGGECRPGVERAGPLALRAHHASLGAFRLDAGPGGGVEPTMLFTENQTNMERVFGGPPGAGRDKDAFHDAVIHNRPPGPPQDRGTKAAFHYRLDVPAGGAISIALRLRPQDPDQADAPPEPLGADFERVFTERRREADEFFNARLGPTMDPERASVARQAYAGLLWSKQFYHYVVDDWLKGDPAQPRPPESRKAGRNSDWGHLFNRDVISMPDKWEYPWYAAWDLAFHCVALAQVDARFAKDQLMLFLREWYMHPNGQLPAYEFAFGDVNPPVHAWACWRVYKITGRKGDRDRDFLARCFQKLLINFTWWVNRKDPWGKNLFAGGFLGLDNIGVFDRSRPLPTGGQLAQADGTAWMAFYCGTMLAMALELAAEDPAYEDMASKFFEHFIAISDAMNSLGGSGLWDEDDGFYYDQLIPPGGGSTPLKVRSLVGIIPLLAVEVLEESTIERLPGFRKRMEWFLTHRKDLARHISYMEENGGSHRHRLLAIPSRERLERTLRCLFDEAEFLSPHGIRSVSRYHKDHPFVFRAGAEEYRVAYLPGESDTAIFGGNSNWRGPVWFPLNFLILESLERYDHFYGDGLTVEFPTGSGVRMNLAQAATRLAERLAGLFIRGEGGKRPCHGQSCPRLADDPAWKDLVLFHEYFHGDTGAGLGASHQTGWTALIAPMLQKLAHPRPRP